MCNLKIFKNHEGNLSQKLSEPNMWLLVNHTKLTSTLLKLISFNSGQLQNRGELQNDTINGATLIAINRVIKVHTCEHGQIIPYC